METIAQGTGRRKTSTARVYIRKGEPGIQINGKNIDEYFPIPEQVETLKRPLMVTDNESKYNILINVKGGGITGQAGACLHGISRALVELDETNRTSLKANGFMTRDSRMVERKKYGRRGARRRFQFSKR